MYFSVTLHTQRHQIFWFIAASLRYRQDMMYMQPPIVYRYDDTKLVSERMEFAAFPACEVISVENPKGIWIASAIPNRYFIVFQTVFFAAIACPASRKRLPAPLAVFRRNIVRSMIVDSLPVLFCSLV